MQHRENIKMKKTILFIGLGNMGYPMACNLVKQGHVVYGFDLSLNKQEDFKKAGGLWLDSLNKVSGLAVDYIIAMLPGGPQMRALYLETQKLFSLLKQGTLIIDCSTADPETCSLLYTEAKKHSLKILCAPVSGGTAGAVAGTLTFMVGGDKQDLEEAKPFFEIMGSRFFHAGGASDGQAAKICNNMLLAIHMIGTCEAFALGESLGLEPKKLNEILKSSSGNNWSLEKYNPYPHIMENVPASRDYEGGFSVKLMLKDLSLALNSINKTKQKAELGTKAHSIYKTHFEKGFENKDFSHIFQSIKNKKR